MSRRSFCLANVYNSIGFCNLLLTNPIRVAASRCNSVLANSIGVAASMLLCLAVPHVGAWCFATHCLQILLEWLHQCCSMMRLRRSMVFFNSLLANPIGVATSMLLCVAVARIGPWSFATHCLQILLGWLHQCCPMLCCCCARSSMVFCNLLPKVDRERTAN